jgi:hypothetical protein
MSIARHAAAAFFAFHAAAVVFLSIPPPPPGLASGAAGAEVDRSVDAWAGVAEQLGLPAHSFRWILASAAGFEGTALDVARAAFLPYADLVGAGQSWRMFGKVPTDCARLEIDVDAGSGWTPLYAGRSPSATWRRALFDEERMRGVVGAFEIRAHRPYWPFFVDWVAREVRRDRPDALAVRVQMRGLEIPAPEVLRATGSLEVREPYWTAERRFAP